MYVCGRFADVCLEKVITMSHEYEHATVPTEFKPMEFPVPKFHPEDVITNPKGWPVYSKLEKV